MQKQCFLIGYYGFGNVGDELLLKKALSLLQKTCPQTRISVLYTETKTEKGVSYISRRSYLSVLKALFRSQEIIFAGGSIFQDHSSVWSFRYYAFLLWLALLFKKSCRLLANGFGPVDDTFNKDLCQSLFPRLTAASFRDHDSFDSFFSYLTKDRLFLSSDLAFYQTQFTDQHWEESAPIALSLRQGDVDFFQLKACLGESDFIGIGTQESEDPLIFSQTQMTESWFESADKGPAASYLISMRYHSCIWAILRGIPFIALGTDPKLRSIAAAVQQVHVETLSELSSTLSDFASKISQYRERLLSSREQFLTEEKDFALCLQ